MRSDRRFKGFSLVELLVVIGVIGVLIALLFPAFSRVRESARATTCLSNLRQIGTAAAAYATKFDGYTLPAGYAHPTENAAGTSTRRDAETWATILVNQKMLVAPDVKTINASVSTEHSVLRCPSGTEDLEFSEFSAAGSGSAGEEIPTRDHGLAQRPTRAKSDRSGVVVDVWYGMNATHRSFNSIQTPGRRLPDHSNPGDFSLVRLSRISDPSRMVFIYDGVWINPMVDADRLAARHGKGRLTNILFYDGHAATFTTKDLPGGMGPNKRDSGDRFSNSALGSNIALKWRLDGK